LEGGGQMGSTWRYYPAIHPEKLRKTTKLKNS